MLLAELVATARAVAAVGSRTAKISLLAELLRRLTPEEITAAIGMVSGEPRQGRIGVGWAAIGAVAVQPAAGPALEIAELDAALSAVQVATGAGSVKARGGLLAHLFARATADEADFIRRLLLGEVRQGALEGIATEAVAKAAGVSGAEVRRALMLSGDLGETATAALTGGAPALAAIGLHVMRPVLPMLAASAGDVATALASTGLASVEWKLDGIRIQVHRSGDAIGVFTRNLNDISGRVPGIVEAVRATDVRDLVLDGEAIGLADDERPHAFQDTMSRIGRHAGEATLGAHFFDVLHVDGEDLLDRPLSARLEALGSIDGLVRIPAITTDATDEAQRFLDDALARGHEGVMIKAIDSIYKAGRRGRSWIKVKPVRTLDLVVLGAEWGHGRRRGWLSNLHLGARDPSGGGFVMVGKTFKGLTDVLLTWQTEQLLAREVRREGIAVFVRPELVVEIALDGVQTSPRYPGGVALRFARVKRYRDDKSPADADTIDTVRAMLP